MRVARGRAGAHLIELALRLGEPVVKPWGCGKERPHVEHYTIGVLTYQQAVECLFRGPFVEKITMPDLDRAGYLPRPVSEQSLQRGQLCLAEIPR